MKKIVMLLLWMIAAVPATAHASWNLGQWYPGPNGHNYSVQKITGDNTWANANAQALLLVDPAGNPCNLAAISSSTEDEFIFDGINANAYWAIGTSSDNEGPFLGGFQYDKLAEPAGHWAWVTGEPWTFTQWYAGKPDNTNGNEDVLNFYARSSSWNDIVTQKYVISYYVAESVPEPTSLAIVALGAITLLRRSRK